jgi:hypothetical protein
MEDDDDGFYDILPAAKTKAPVLIGCAKGGRNGVPRISFTFNLDTCDPEVAEVINLGPRFVVAFNPVMRVFRIKVDPLGRYETFAPSKAGGRVQIIRVPLPEALQFVEGFRERVEPDFNPIAKFLMIDVPRPLWAGQRITPPSAKLVLRDQVPALRGAVSMLGDPEPGRSALDLKRGR